MQGDPPEKTSEDLLKYALDSLEGAMFRFCVFCDGFKKYCVKKGLVDENKS